jgi:hypothetical protein
MGAIRACRTAALGGHVMACGDCDHATIAYNSCRNRHCPRCQGAASKDWLVDRQADLLPVPYYHLVVTLPAPIAVIDQRRSMHRQRSELHRCLFAMLIPARTMPTAVGHVGRFGGDLYCESFGHDRGIEDGSTLVARDIRTSGWPRVASTDKFCARSVSGCCDLDELLELDPTTGTRHVCRASIAAPV